MLLFLDIGTSELFVIILFIIIFFGSKKIPELARGLGKGIREFKDATSEIQQEITKSANDIKKETDITKHLKD
ncbi:MAG TPA: twin-arginine translocase TatA/TatE family subunit [Flavobacteriales bacterium]|nr:twin-arginine translocase TatA/TatE family subunit [Flavobacteriales bacterium]|tara:strand:- start:24428 stop:24646 length:219 start_codon:yes stop_codon:yes gene_type:complete